MAHCPYCSGRVLRHVQKAKVYWFCRHCWQKVQIVDAPSANHSHAAFDTSERQLSIRPSLGNSLDKYDSVMRL